MNIIRKIFIFILAAAGTGGIGYLANLASGNPLFTQSFWGLLVFAALLFVFNFLSGRITADNDSLKYVKRQLGFSAAFSWFLGVTLVLGYQIRCLQMTSGGITGKLFILFMGALSGCAIWPGVYWLFGVCGKFKTGNKHITSKSGRQVFFIAWGIIFLCWIPVFLAYYPAVMSYDFNMQSVQIFTGLYHTHHPLIHTGLLWIFFRLGECMGSYQAGMAFFALFQMLILSCVTGYSCTFIWRIFKKKAAGGPYRTFLWNTSCSFRVICQYNQGCSVQCIFSFIFTFVLRAGIYGRKKQCRSGSRYDSCRSADDSVPQ